jgi:MFS family permease
VLTQRVRPSGRKALVALNFFMADTEAGIGPFLGVLLASRGWGTGAIGAVTALGAIAGMLATTPAGAAIDATRHKRAWVIGAALTSVAASGLMLVSQRFWAIAAAQAAACVAGATIAPAVIGLTLGVVRQSGFTAQNGRNQAFNHAGNVVGATLSGLLGWWFGFAAVFWLAAMFGVLTIAAVLLIPAGGINDQAARGAAVAKAGTSAQGLKVLVESRPLLTLGAALMLFWLGNAAMLPLYGLAVVAARANPFTTVASTIVVAQAVMIVAAFAAMKIAETRGYWLAVLIALCSLPIRAVIAAGVITSWGVLPVEVLDGIGGGMLSVAVPGLVARILDGTGRINAGQGAIMGAQGLGGALSPALGGFIAQAFGFRAAFLLLGVLSLGSLAIWLGFASMLRRASGAPSQASADDAPADSAHQY